MHVLAFVGIECAFEGLEGIKFLGLGSCSLCGDRHSIVVVRLSRVLAMVGVQSTGGMR